MIHSITFTLLFICMIITDATGDAFRKTSAGHWHTWLLEELLILYWMIFALWISYYSIPVITLISFFIGYILMRMALFNPVWNLMFNATNPEPILNKIPWWYYGKHKWYDRFLGWIIERSWFGRKFKPYPWMVVGILSVFSFLFALVFTGIFDPLF